MRALIDTKVDIGVTLKYIDGILFKNIVALIVWIETVADQDIGIDAGFHHAFYCRVLSSLIRLCVPGSDHLYPSAYRVNYTFCQIQFFGLR